MSASEVLNAFHRDAPYLFLGAAFAAVGIVSAAFAILRRKLDSLLIFFALFAAPLRASPLDLVAPACDDAQGRPFYARLHAAVNYVTLIPAFLFSSPWVCQDDLSGQLDTRWLVSVAYSLRLPSVGGDSALYERINSIAVITASGFFVIRFMANGSAESSATDAADFAVVRWGLLIFVAFVVWQNIAGFYLHFLATTRALRICRISQHSGLCCCS